MRKRIIGILLTIIIASTILGLFGIKISVADMRQVTEQQIAKTIDKVFTFKKEKKIRPWKIIDLKVKGERKSFLITPVNLTSEEKDALRGKELIVNWQ